MEIKGRNGRYRKRYEKLGRTKLMKLPERIDPWIKEFVRELDSKDDPEEVMAMLSKLLKFIN
jgi:hypothetical protein